MKGRIRVEKPNSISKDGIVTVVITSEVNKVECTIPVSDFAYALMGVSGIDCELSIHERTL